MKEKSILIPAYDFKPLLGGVANYGHELAVQLSRRARVYVLTRKLDGMDELIRPALRHYPYPRTAQRGARLPVVCQGVGPLVGLYQPDAVFCPMWFPDGAACRRVLGTAPIPYFVAAHGTEVFQNTEGAKNILRSLLLGGLKTRVFQGRESDLSGEPLHAQGRARGGARQ